jgi:hypothetical protein
MRRAFIVCIAPIVDYNSILYGTQNLVHLINLRRLFNAILLKESLLYPILLMLNEYILILMPWNSGDSDMIYYFITKILTTSLLLILQLFPKLTILPSVCVSTYQLFKNLLKSLNKPLGTLLYRCIDAWSICVILSSYVLLNVVL